MASPAAPNHEAAQRLTTEMWVLLGVVSVVTVLRTVSRVRNNRYKNLQLDDYLVWIGLLCFAAEAALAYNLGTKAHGLANSGMSDAYRQSLPKDSDEHRQRVMGSIIHLCGWSVYSVSLWALKASWLAFYSRLTDGLGRSYRIRIRVGFIMVIVTWIAGFMNQLLSCRPFSHYWQIHPDPGNLCHPALSNSIVWVWYAFNVSTDLYLLSIPLPMLWGARLGKMKKFGLMLLFSGGVFVIICATLRAALIITDPVDGTLVAGAWGVRETFVAITTTNLPLVFALLKAWFGPWLGIQLSTRRSSRKQTDGTADPSRNPGAGSSGRIWRNGSSPTAKPLPRFTVSESEERIVSYDRTGDVEAPTRENSSPTTESGAETQDSIKLTVMPNGKSLKAPM